MQALIAAAKRSRASSGGLIAVGKEVRIIGVGVVTPTSKPEGQICQSAARPDCLRHSPVTKATESIEKGLQLEGMQFQEGPSASSIALADPLGKTIAFLGWRPSNPGYEAFRKATPILGLVLLMRLLALALVLSYSYRYTELRRSALTDALSNLPNRTSPIRSDPAHAPREHISLAFLDLDGFKAVNDNYGHSVGDQLIRQCSDRRAVSPPIARWSRGLAAMNLPFCRGRRRGLAHCHLHSEPVAAADDALLSG
ncbi:MAG: diguanylate cyclase [Sphingomonadales bacterium]|nr:diguanylate cyclase [Sphingomonadales bacterium]